MGAGVTQFQPGDAVYGESPDGGSFAEYVCAPGHRLAPKPANLSFEQAAAVPMAAVTALRGLHLAGPPQPGQEVLINGASGGVGTFAVQIARALGAGVTGVCSGRNVDLVRSIRADRVIDYTREDVTRMERAYDLILDAAAYPINIRLPARAASRRHLRDDRRLDVALAPSPDARVAGFDGRKQEIQIPGVGNNHGGSGIPDRATGGGQGGTDHRPALRVERRYRRAAVPRDGTCPGQGRHHRRRLSAAPLTSAIAFFRAPFA